MLRIPTDQYSPDEVIKEVCEFIPVV
jgi:hypothetical protein